MHYPVTGYRKLHVKYLVMLSIVVDGCIQFINLRRFLLHLEVDYVY